MKTQLAVLLAALALAFASHSHATEGLAVHHHASGHAEPAKLHLNGGKKWATDETLRQAMNDINQAMAQALPAIHAHRFGQGDYQALAAKVSGKVTYMVEHCQLAPEADAMLHLLVAELIAGTDIMDGKTSQKQHEGALRVLEALRSYGKYFQHPGWRVAKG